jgi:hypothetical protein
LRLDRLYFRHDFQQLRLAGAGTFRTDVSAASADAALRKAVDAVITSRGPAAVTTDAFVHAK